MIKKNIPLALKAYEHIRLPFATDVMTRSGKTGALYEFRSPEAYDDAAWVPELEKQFEWVYGEDPVDQLAEAIRWMGEQPSGSVGHKL